MTSFTLSVVFGWFFTVVIAMTRVMPKPFSLEVMDNLESNNCVSAQVIVSTVHDCLVLNILLYRYLHLCARLTFYSERKKRKKHTLFAVHLNLGQTFFISVDCGVNRSYFVGI